MPPTAPVDPWPLPELTRARRAIVVVDVVESVRLMQEDEAGFIDRWRRFVHQVRNEVLPKHGGRMVKSLGDGMLLEFGACPSAVLASSQAQGLVTHLDPMTRGVAIRLRIGVHASEVVEDALDIYGVGVNLAARLATLAEPGEIIVSAEVRDGASWLADVEFVDLGECFLKHIDNTIRAFRVGGPAPTLKVNATRRRERTTPTLFVSPSDAGALLARVVADELVAVLARSDQWIVISRLSTMAAAGQPLPFDTLAERYAIDYVISCSVHERRNDARVHMELSDARTGATIWGQAFPTSATALFGSAGVELFSVAAAAIASAVVVQEIGRARGFALPSLDAYALLLSGIARSHSASLSEAQRGQRALDHLIDRHPRRAEPKVWMAKWHVMQIAQGWAADASKSAVQARLQVTQALDQQPDHALGLAMHAHLAFFLDRDLDRAEVGCNQALRLDPNEPMAWLFLSAVHAHRGDGAQATACVERAAATSPMDPLGYYFDGFRAAAALAAEDFAASARWAGKSIRANRSHVPSYITHAIASALAGDIAAARESARVLKMLIPSFSSARYVDRFPGGDRPKLQRYRDALAMADAPP